MSLAELRDLMIVIFTISAVLTMIIFIVLSLLVFSKIRAILESGAEAAANISKMTSVISDLMKPLSVIGGFMQGVFRAMEYFTRGSRRKEDRGERSR